MLTKQERATIAERLKDIDFLTENALYKAVTGKCVSVITTYSEDVEAMIKVVSDLCDTSNMVELPLDKDGEVIRVGDTVYIGDGIKYEVTRYMMRGNSTEVILAAGAEPVYTKEPANNTTHKKPVTIKSLAQRIKHVLEDEATSIGVNPYVELGRIAEQLESLGDSDD